MHCKALCVPRSQGSGIVTKTYRIMRITAILLLAACLQVSARGDAQTVTLSERNVPLQKVFKSIHRQTGFQFFYKDELLNQAGPVSIEVKNVPLDEVLAQCFRHLPIVYTIVGKAIVVKSKEIPVIQAGDTSFQPHPLVVVHGIVTTENGQPLNGATIRQWRGRIVAIADEKGNFEARNITDDATLEITFTGYETRLVKAGFQNVLHIMLKVSTSKLDEIQVIAYGTTTQRYNVGSVSRVTSKELEQQPVSNVLSALEGRVPGMVVTQSSGLPGAAIKVQVRGQNTLNRNPSLPLVPDNPLFIIDGVPVAAQNGNINQLMSLAYTGTFDPAGGMSALNSINPADIESIDVLRDADATAIYGSRGSNGVILITTKKGKPGKTRFSGNVWSGESRVTRTMPMMNTQQYLEMRREAISNDGATPQVAQSYLPGYAPDLLIFDTTRNVDWKKYLMGGTAKTTDANASVSGGNENTQFLIGAGYHHETYIMPGDFADNRASVNMNLHHTSNDKKLTLDFSTNYSFDQNNSSGGADALKAFTLMPDYPELLNPDGSLSWSYKGVHSGGTYGNPLSYLKKSYKLQTNNLISHFQADYQILPGLNIRSSFGYNTLNSNETSLNPKAAQDPTLYTPVSTADFGTNNFQTWIIEPQVQYKKNIGRGRLDVLIGGSIQQNTNTSTRISASNFSNDALLGSVSAAGSTISTDGYTLYRYNAGFGRINYIQDNKYILNLTGRRDGSSRFGPGRQFGNFGSVAGGWIFSEERFMKRALPVLSYGKVHVSYGSTGNDNISDYAFLPNWTPTSGISYEGSTGYTPVNLFNPDYSWEVNRKLEIGLELGFLKDRILINSAWFRNRSGNQLIPYDLPTQTGFMNVVQNFAAEVQNTGFELQINSKNMSGKFGWTSSFNVTVPSNKLIAFPGLETSSYAYSYIVGKSTSIVQGYRYLDVNPNTGVLEYLTAKGTPTYAPKYGNASLGGDYHVLKNLDPKYYGGLDNTFSYKGFQLSLFFQFTKQLGYNYLKQIYNGGLVGGTTNQPVALLDRWQKPGDQTNIQKFTESYSSDAYRAASYYSNSDATISDASFIRLKTVSFSYSFNNGYFRKRHLDGCRVYMNAQNLLTITSYKGNDPESRSFYNVPPLKTIVAGIQFNF